jgi:predicted transcriptional regulator
MQTFPIQVDSLSNQAVTMYAKVVHGNAVFKNVNAADILASLSAACNNQFKPVQNSVKVLDAGRVNAVVRAIMVPAIDVLPLETAQANMQSLSKNMFLDGDENMWTLRESDSGNVVVRALTIDNPEELVDMMSSCSSAQGVDDPFTHNIINRYEQELSHVEGGDFISYFSSKSGAVVTGFVVAEVEDNGHTTLLALSSNQEPEQIERSAIITYISGDEIAYPEDVKVSVSASADSNRLIQYYKQVYAYNPEYFKNIEAMILNSFA